MRSDRFRKLTAMLLIAVPWRLRRPILGALFGYRIHPTARIGASLVYPRFLDMGPNSRIGTRNVIGAIDRVELAEGARIGRGNRVFGLAGDSRVHFGEEPERRSALILGAHAAIVSNHAFDCCNSITIGAFVTVAGTGTQIFTHGIDVRRNRQRSAPVHIGAYSMIGTGCTILKGSSLPDCSILGAGAVLSGSFEESHGVYQGVPAVRTGSMPADAAYFHRTDGHVS